MRVLLALGVAVTFTSAAFLVVEPLYAGRVLGRPPAQFALFEAVAGAGAVLASLVMSRRLPRWLPSRARRVCGGRRGAHPGLRAPALAACGYGLSAVVFAGTPWIPVAYAGAFAWGVSGAVFAVTLATALQQRVPLQAQGRVMGLASAVESAAETGGLPAAGIVLALLGLRGGTLALAGVAAAVGLAVIATSSGPAPPGPAPPGGPEPSPAREALPCRP